MPGRAGATLVKNVVSGCSAERIIDCELRKRPLCSYRRDRFVNSGNAFGRHDRDRPARPLEAVTAVIGRKLLELAGGRSGI